MESVSIIIDCNTNFLTQLGSHINQLHQSIRTALGILSFAGINNRLRIYMIDSHDVFQIYPQNKSLQTFAYGKEYEAVLDKFQQVILEKNKDITTQSKLTKCLSKILCQLNKEQSTSRRICFITWMSFTFNVQQYTEFLQLVTHAGKIGVRFDLIHVVHEQVQILVNEELAKSEALKLGVQLTGGIHHEIRAESKFGIITAMMLGVLNPGEGGGFTQAKLSSQVHISFCACCNKNTGQTALACSHCLAIHCKKVEQCVSCKCLLL